MSTQVGDIYGVGQFMPGGKEGNQAKAFVYILVIVVVIVIIFFVINKVFGGIDALLERLGLKDTAEEAAAKKKITDTTAAASKPGSPWSPEFYKSAPANTPLIKVADAQKLAKQIWDSVGIFYDDPEQGLGAIKQMSSQAIVSWVADNFNKMYQRDMYDWLRMKYDTSNQRLVMTEIIDYVNALKKY